MTGGALAQRGDTGAWEGEGEGGLGGGPGKGGLRALRSPMVVSVTVHGASHRFGLIYYLQILISYSQCIGEQYTATYRRRNWPYN